MDALSVPGPSGAAGGPPAASRREALLRPGPARGAVLLVAASALFAMMAVCGKVASHALDGAGVAAVRFAFGVAVGALLVATGHVARPAPRRPWLVTLRSVLGGVSVLFYFGAIEHLPVGLATLLNCTSPVFTALFARVFLKEPLGGRVVAALALAAVGVGLVVGGRPGALEVAASPAAAGAAAQAVDVAAAAAAHAVDVFWVVVGLVSAVLSGGAVTTIRAMRRGAEPEATWDIFLVFCAVGLACSVPFAHVRAAPSLLEWAAIVGVGATAFGAQLLMTSALRWVPAAHFGTLTQLTVVFTAALGALALGEPWTALSLAGAALTLGAVGWAARPGV